MPPLKVDWCGRKISILGLVKKETERDRCVPLQQATSRERESRSWILLTLLPPALRVWMRGQMLAYCLAVVVSPN
jgi:hypothetical protein